MSPFQGFISLSVFILQEYHPCLQQASLRGQDLSLVPVSCLRHSIYFICQSTTNPPRLLTKSIRAGISLLQGLELFPITLLQPVMAERAMLST
jgi:hypothetical protein